MKLIKILITSILILTFNSSYADETNISDKSEYVVILHGIARSNSHMEPLAEYLQKHGYKVLNIDYPSTKHKIEQLIEILDLKISKKIDKAPKVNFIGYSMGGILVRGYLNKHRPKNLGKVIQLAAPNHGSEVADFLKNNWLYKTIYGPAGQQLTTSAKLTKQLFGEVYYELGVVAGNSTIDPVSSYIIDGDDDGKVSIKSTKTKGMKDHVVVPASHTFFPSNDDVHKQVLHFLQNGKFDKTKKE